MGFIICCANSCVEPLGELFDYFFTINRYSKGWISLTPRVLKHKSLLVVKEGPRVDTTYLMTSGGSKDLDDWKSRYVFVRPWGSDASQVWFVCNEWTLNIKRPRPKAENLMELIIRILKGIISWQDSWLSSSYLMTKGLDSQTCKCLLRLFPLSLTSLLFLASFCGLRPRSSERVGAFPSQIRASSSHSGLRVQGPKASGARDPPSPAS